MKETQKLAVIREQLQTELDSLQEQQRTIELRLDDRPEFGLGEGDPASSTWEMDLARRQRLEIRVAELRESLERLDQGTYGVCRECGRQIDPERLEILPTTVVCAECAGAELTLPTAKAGGF